MQGILGIDKVRTRRFLTRKGVMDRSGAEHKGNWTAWFMYLSVRHARRSGMPSRGHGLSKSFPSFFRRLPMLQLHGVWQFRNAKC